jgi:hypothetical protein
MNQPTHATAAASGGVAGAAVVIITWLLSLFHLEVPAEVAAAAMVVLTPIVHLIAVRLNVGDLSEPTPAPTPAPVPAPPPAREA